MRRRSSRRRWRPSARDPRRPPIPACSRAMPGSRGAARVGERGQRLLDRGKARVLRSERGELQRQSGERGRVEALAARDAQRADVRRARAPDASKASASAGTWKLPFDSIAVASAITSGLSAALLSSSSTSSRADVQCGEHGAVHLREARNDSGSCTRRAAPVRARGRCRPAVRRDGARSSCCPRAGRAACTRGSSGDRFARKPFEGSAPRRRSAHRARMRHRAGRARRGRR